MHSCEILLVVVFNFIAMSFCISLTNYIKIKWQIRDIMATFKMAVIRHVGFVLGQ